MNEELEDWICFYNKTRAKECTTIIPPLSMMKEKEWERKEIGTSIVNKLRIVLSFRDKYCSYMETTKEEYESVPGAEKPKC